jgi:hypothetical protein
MHHLVLPLLCRYEGDWCAAVYEGCGSETFSKGSTYHGQYAGGLRHGWGMCRFFNGDYYEGQWSRGLRDGTGMQQVGHRFWKVHAPAKALAVLP